MPTLPGAAAAAERAAALARLGLPAAGGAGGGDADGRLALAGELAAGCRQMYLVGGPHHLGPEITHFDGARARARFSLSLHSCPVRRTCSFARTNGTASF